ncbi:MAG: HD domain-containing protein [Bacteroidetes bacterium]|nr:HD domain-containing protein [Bacteroidota bacterium]
MPARKIINDPIYGFINVTDDLIFELIEHPFFQRLRRIRQLGLTGLIYPGATHTRFHHALGAMHLMHRAIAVLRSKDVEISDQEELDAKCAILLHDIGHGPFSHVLEKTIIKGTKHEVISLRIMEMLNIEFNGALSGAIEIFTDKYPKRFLHQLVSSQLDMDRLDYLTRDSFYTGVSEGIVGLERIIQMLNVVNDQLVIDEKGIYSIEKFIVARRLMYWQVYLHKTALAADTLLHNIVRRARQLYDEGIPIFTLPNFQFFVENTITPDNLKDKEILNRFNSLDDIELFACIKYWVNEKDRLLAHLSYQLINRKLPSCKIQSEEFPPQFLNSIKQEVMSSGNWSESEVNYLVQSGVAENEAYHSLSENIFIRRKDGSLIDLVKASDNYNFLTPDSVVRKYFICTPK